MAGRKHRRRSGIGLARRWAVRAIAWRHPLATLLVTSRWFWRLLALVAALLVLRAAWLSLPHTTLALGSAVSAAAAGLVALLWRAADMSTRWRRHRRGLAVAGLTAAGVLALAGAAYAATGR